MQPKAIAGVTGQGLAVRRMAKFMAEEKAPAQYQGIYAALAILLK